MWYVLRYLFVFSIIVIISSSAHAQLKEWTGNDPCDNLWTTSGNWTTGSVPTSSDDVYVGEDNANKVCEIDANIAAVVQSIVVARWQGSNIVLNMTGGSLTITNGPFEIGKWVGTGTDGTVNLFGGSIIVQNGDMEVGNRGDAFLNMTGGAIDISGTLWVCNQDGSGTIDLDGGTITAADLDSTITTGSRSINITDGRIILNGDKTTKVQGMVDDGWITAFDTNAVSIVYDTATDKTHIAGIGISPVYLLLSLGEKAVFTLDSNLPGITTYNWYKSTDNSNDTPGDDTLVQSGASNSLTISSVDANDEAYYYCVQIDTGSQEYYSTVGAIAIKRMLALWTLDSDSNSFNGSQYIDISTEDEILHNADVNGTPVFVPGVNPAVTNQAVLIDANNGWATAGTWDPTGRTGQFTVSLWANSNDSNSFQNIISKKDGSTSATSNWQLVLSSTQEAIFWADEKGAIIEEGFPHNSWAMVTVIYNNGTAYLYINGVQRASLQFDLADKTDALISIGKWTDQVFSGALDDIRIYNYALTHQQLAALYENVTGQQPCDPTAALSADVTGALADEPDCIVNLYDFAKLADMWLDCLMVYQENCP